MRIATWNVNSLGARLQKVTWWLERAQPDVLLMQETKLADAAGTASRSRAGVASPR
jgi:exodeoxyribonuclease-3